MSEQDADSGSVEEELARIVGRSTSDSPEERPSADDVEVRDALVAEIESTDSETVARAVELLRTELERAEDALAEEHERAEDLESRLKRKQADFQNYKKRQEERMEEEIERATEDLVTRLLTSGTTSIAHSSRTRTPTSGAESSRRWSSSTANSAARTWNRSNRSRATISIRFATRCW